MTSGFDPRLARWEQVEVLACRSAVVRTSAPAGLLDASPEALLADVTAGLTERFPQVLPIEVRADPPETPHGSVRLVHAAVGPDGDGVAIETLLLRSGEVCCWVAPAARYAAEREAARRAMAGRPPLHREENPAPAGVPVAELRLTVAGSGEGDWLVARHGPAVYARAASAATTSHAAASAAASTSTSAAVPTSSAASAASPSDGVELPVSLLPVWLASVTGTGPRPVPGERPLLVVARSGLDRLLDGPADARTALDAPELTAAEAAELDALARDLVRRWSLEWIFGSDGDASPRLEARGRLEILDAGPSHGLWRVLTDLPEALTSELPDEQPVGLMRTTSADVWHELTLPLADWA